MQFPQLLREVWHGVYKTPKWYHTVGQNSNIEYARRADVSDALERHFTHFQVSELLSFLYLASWYVLMLCLRNIFFQSLKLPLMQAVPRLLYTVASAVIYETLVYQQAHI